MKIINPYLWILLISMMPVVELTGALPVAAMMNLSFWPSFLISLAGNMLPVPFLILFSKKLLAWLATQPVVGNFFTRYIAKADQEAKRLGKYELIGLCLYVALPLPLTGAWTGAVIAAILRLRMRPAFVGILLGVIINGLVVGVVAFGITSIYDLLTA